MNATITKIDPPKASKTQATFIRIYFKGTTDLEWYQTDIVPIYRNYKQWKPIIESGVGTVVGNLNLKVRMGKSKVDADSPAIIIKRPEVKQPTGEQLTII